VTKEGGCRGLEDIEAEDFGAEDDASDAESEAGSVDSRAKRCCHRTVVSEGNNSL